MPYRNDTDKHIYLDADKSRIVEEGSADAAFLLVGPGGEVSDADAEKYGLVKSTDEAESADQADKPATRSVPRAADKAQADAPETKGK